MHAFLSLVLLTALEARESLVIKLPDQALCVTFSPDGKRIACTTGEDVKVFDATTGRELLSLTPTQDASVSSVTFSGDGKHLATGSADGTIKLWTADGRELFSFKQRRNNVDSVTFSADGKWLVAEDGNIVRIYDLSKGQPAISLKGHADLVLRNAFSPNSRQLATSSQDKTVRIWDVESGQLLRVLRVPSGPGRAGSLSTAALSADGKTLEIAFEDKRHGTTSHFVAHKKT